MTTKILFSVLAMLGCLSVYSQFGISAKYNYELKDEADFNNQYNPERPHGGGYEVGINYWFRLKKKRLEFLPELAYSKTMRDINANPSQLIPYQVDRMGIHAMIGVQLYPLDFDGDCNCPTFSNKSKVFEKGFFWRFALGVSHYSWENTSGNNEPISNSTTEPFISVGMGLDVGLSELVTITPFLNLNWTSLDSWNNHDYVSDDNMWYFQPGIRSSFRFRGSR